MNRQYDQVNDAISQLEEIQARQVENFDTELMPDLDAQNLEREQGVELLKHETAGFLEGLGREDLDEEAQSMISRLSDRINILLEQNQMLTLRVERHKDVIRQSLKGLAKGKKVIGAYRSPTSVSNRPRAISLTN